MVVADVLLDDSKEQGLFFCNVVLICFFIIKWYEGIILLLQTKLLLALVFYKDYNLKIQ